jgi:bacterioferritin-associated ferredoxin
MFVCVCRAVSEDEVKRAIERGARTVSAVTAACCAGDDCGACHGAIEDLIERGTESPVRGPRVLPVIPERAA